MSLQLSESDVRLRELRLEDYDRWVELYKQYDPDGPSADHQRKRHLEWVSTDPRLALVAETPDGKAVAFGRIQHRSHQLDGAFYLALDVDPAYEGRGIGRKLLGTLEAYARECRGWLYTAFVREGNERARRFMERNGYPHERDLFASHLDFTSFDMTPFESQRAESRSDLEIKSWRELGDTPENRRRLHDLISRSDTAPDKEVWGVADFEQFEKDTFGAPWYTPDGLIVAIVEGIWAGHHFSGPNEPGSAEWTTDYTGVAPEFRGRGIGMALKLRSIEIARAAGATRTTTHNDSENQWMLAINRKLGFVREPGWWQMRKRIER